LSKAIFITEVMIGSEATIEVYIQMYQNVYQKEQTILYKIELI
jgi:hypothetical protein